MPSPDRKHATKPKPGVCLQCGGKTYVLALCPNCDAASLPFSAASQPDRFMYDDRRRKPGPRAGE